MAYGLSPYLEQLAEEELDPAMIGMNDVLLAQNAPDPAMPPEPVMTDVRQANDLAQLYDQKMREALLQEQQGASQFEKYIQDYQAKPRGIDWTAAAALFDNPRLMQAAQGMRPPSQDEKAQNLLALQQKLQQLRGGISKNQLQALANQLKLQQAAQEAQRRKEMQDQRLAFEKERTGAYTQNAKAIQDLKKQELALRERELGARQDRADERQQAGLAQKEQARLDNDIQKLEKRVGEMAPGIKTKLDNLDQLLPGGIDGEDTDIPGTGPGAFLVPDFMQSETASEIQQNARGLMADLIKLQSGTAASDQEVARKLKERGMGPGSKSSSFRRGLKLLKQEIANDLKKKEAGFRPEVKKIYQERGGLTHEAITGGGQKPAGPMSFEEWKKSKGL